MASRRKNLEVRLIVSAIVIEQPANVHNRRSFLNNETRYATRYSQDFMANRPFLLESPHSITPVQALSNLNSGARHRPLPLRAESGALSRWLWKTP